MIVPYFYCQISRLNYFHFINMQTFKAHKYIKKPSNICNVNFEWLFFFSNPSSKRRKHNSDENTNPVKLLTAGISSHQVKFSQSNMVIYVLAGHTEYHSSHSSILEAISITNPSVFLLLVKLLLPFDAIIKQLYYWSAMISYVCHKCCTQSSVIVIGTHSDFITDREKLEALQKDIETVAKDAIKKHIFVQLFQ